jgi:hypothetical protein
MSVALIEEEWGADALIDEARRRGAPFVEMSRADMRALTRDEFVSFCPVFASTDIVQHHGVAAPDTYPPQLAALYHRAIARCRARDIAAFPVFIKPVGNAKEWAGRVVHRACDLPAPDAEVYTSPVLDFATEHRLLVGGGKLWAQARQRGAPDPPPYPFVDAVVALAGAAFLCIDVGRAGAQWLVIEVNPPYALDDYDVDVRVYWDYCAAAWRCATAGS